MNARRITLILMAVNLGLLAIVAYIVYAMKWSPAIVTEPGRTKILTNTITQIAVRKINATNLLAALANRPLNWRALESTNYFLYIENLRNFGCPEETIRDIIITDVAKLYARRRAELRAQAQPYKFWQTYDALNGGPRASPELQRRLRDLEKEQRALIRELLGVDYRTELAKYWNDDSHAERNYDFLPQAKRELVKGALEKYTDLEEEVYSRAGGLLLDEDQETLKQIQKQREAELASILSPEEMEEYQLRYSETANNLRLQLSGFEPNEDEFRKIFRLQKTFDDQFNQAFDSRDDAAMAIKAKAQEDAEAALSGELGKVLGPERYAEYVRAQDADYRSLVQVTERLQAPRDMANKVYEMKVAAERQKEQVESNPNLTDAQRAQALAAIARETERSVAGVMGEDVFRAYQKTGGQWLGNLLVVNENNLPPAPEPPPQTTVPQIPPELRNLLLIPPILPPPK